MSRFHASLRDDERAQLEACLDDQRAEIARLLDGLTESEARRRLVPSLTTLLGLVKHATFVEQVWFPVALGGRTRAEIGVPETVDESFTLTDADTITSIGEHHLRACEESRALAAGFALDDEARHNRRGPLTLRWIHIHLIQELARHAGHGDILREQVLADRGR